MSQKFQKLVEFFAKLPGIGPRQATRLVLAIVKWPAEDIAGFADTIQGIKNGAMQCGECFNFSDSEKCEICSSIKRDKTKIAVVEKVTDLQSMEKTGTYNGTYHVIGGVINPAGGNMPGELKISELTARITKLLALTPDIEVIIATNPNTYGETTALYIEEELKPLGIKTTRLARGLSAGSSLEYADEITLANALKHRR